MSGGVDVGGGGGSSSAEEDGDGVTLTKVVVS